MKGRSGDPPREEPDLVEARVRERTTEIQSLFQQVISIQEQERRRIARDIHDQVGQQMTALRMSLEAWRSRSGNDPALVEHAERTMKLADELDQCIDYLTWELRPAALDQFGLSSALRNLVTGWSQRFGIPADFDASGDDGARLPMDVEANLYRLVQEALHNVVKHAGATHVTVVLDRGADETVLVVEDNGCGFVASATSEYQAGLGLISMRERAALVGGRLEIETNPGNGTAVFVRVPVFRQGA
jgi:two-component system sensor histidine kinase NreB